ncbi:hypothetical protein J2W46_005795 [Paraburkholderia strydomiana]|nr:hypothetical protein [Paraburkholderia strydomiana]
MTSLLRRARRVAIGAKTMGGWSQSSACLLRATFRQRQCHSDDSRSAQAFGQIEMNWSLAEPARESITSSMAYHYDIRTESRCMARDSVDDVFKVNVAVRRDAILRKLCDGDAKCMASDFFLVAIGEIA